MSTTAGKLLVERYEQAADAEIDAHMELVVGAAKSRQLFAEHRQRLAELRLKMEQAIAEYEAAWRECRVEGIEADKRSILLAAAFRDAQARTRNACQDVLLECGRRTVPESEMAP